MSNTNKGKAKLVCPYCKNTIEPSDSHGKMIQRGSIRGRFVDQTVTCLLVRTYEVEVLGEGKEATDAVHQD
jgi:hypothetical protein